MNFIWYILIGLIIGLIIGRTRKLKGGKLIAYIIIGGAGGILGGWLFTLLINWGVWGNLIMAAAISILILWITTFLTKSSSTEETKL